jgi:hypothetical protein
MTAEDTAKRQEPPPREQVVDPNDVKLDDEWNPEYPGYWDHHGRSKEEYLEYVGSGQADEATPPKVYQSGEHYVLASDGSHRVAAAQELGRPITVEVVPDHPASSEDAEEVEEQELSQ